MESYKKVEISNLHHKPFMKSKHRKPIFYLKNLWVLLIRFLVLIVMNYYGIGA